MSKLPLILTRHGQTIPILYIDDEQQPILILELID